jgi:hypothetical protein
VPTIPPNVDCAAARRFAIPTMRRRSAKKDNPCGFDRTRCQTTLVKAQTFFRPTWKCFFICFVQSRIDFGGARRNRTAVKGFAGPCLSTWLSRHGTQYSKSSTQPGCVSERRGLYRLLATTSEPYLPGHSKNQSEIANRVGINRKVMDNNNARKDSKSWQARE